MQESKVIRSLTATLVSLALFTMPAAAKDKKADPAVGPKPEVRAFVYPSCFVSTAVVEKGGQLLNFAGLDVLTSFIPTLVNTGYSALISSLKSAGDPKATDQKLSAAPFYMYKANVTTPAVKADPKQHKAAVPAVISTSDGLGCVVIVYGTFEPGGTIAGVQQLRAGDSCQSMCSPGKPDDCAACLKKNGKIPVSKLHALYEAQVEVAEDRTAITYDSKYFQVLDWFQTGREGRDHSYIVTLSLASPGGKAPDDNVQSTAILDLGVRQLNTVYTSAELTGSGWVSGGVGMTDLDKSRLTDLSSSSVQKSIELHPTTLFATINESIEGSAFAKKLADILDAAKTDATAAITKAATPSTYSDQKKKAASDLETARQTEESSYKAYLAAKVAQESGTAATVTPPPTDLVRQQMQFAVDSAQRAWCRDWNAISALKGVPPPRTGSDACAAMQ
jgi:hypothetical protein